MSSPNSSSIIRGSDKDFCLHLGRAARQRIKNLLSLKRGGPYSISKTRTRSLVYRHLRLLRKIKNIDKKVFTSQRRKLRHKWRIFHYFQNLTTTYCNGGDLPLAEPSISAHQSLPGIAIQPQHLTADIPCQTTSSNLHQIEEYTSTMPTDAVVSRLDPPTDMCGHCSAFFWFVERSYKCLKKAPPRFTLCCKEGRIVLPPIPKPPALLEYLLWSGTGVECMNFRREIRTYNAMFAMTSNGGKIDGKINNGNAPYVFRMNGQNYHRLGSMLPRPGQDPFYAQLYIYDTQNEVDNRLSALNRLDGNSSINREIVTAISIMLDENNSLVKSFRLARDRYQNNPTENFSLRLLKNRSRDGRLYNMPTTSEVAGLVVGDLDNPSFERDVIVSHCSNGLQRINELHPSFMALSYPLIHPYGEDGFHQGILMQNVGSSMTRQKCATIRGYYCYKFQQRPNEGQTLLRSGRLLQQYMVDAFVAIEEGRLRWIRHNQKQLRSELYSGLMDAMHRGDSNPRSLGKSIILPSSHTGSPRYKSQYYQDAMAICRWAGYPDIFLTFTCNPKWPEMNDMLSHINCSDDPNRHDLVSRVFHIKLKQLMDDLKTSKPFGGVVACLYTVEFQKRGLPHAHILLFLEAKFKNPTPSRIDEIVSAELPNPSLDLPGFNVVNKNMMHGPCGTQNPQMPCTIKKVCTKHFPKPWNSRTTIDDAGFPIYRRRNTGIHVTKKGHVLDNRYVVPFNRNLCVKFDAHINVEICNHSRAIKYLFKYIHKGPDRAMAVINSQDESPIRDEIKSYLDCRYISAAEACWRIFEYDIHYRQPAVERLPFHLPGEHTVNFHEEGDVSDILSQPHINRTKFTEWMELNKRDLNARKFTYSEITYGYVWQPSQFIWKPRKRGKVLGRMYYAHPTSGEKFYLRMLLNITRGATCYEDIRTVDGKLYPTFKAACFALGLLDDDNEWNECLIEASNWASGYELRHLFVTLITQCQVANVPNLWAMHCSILSEDILTIQKKKYSSVQLEITEQQIQALALYEIEMLLMKMGKSLTDFEGMPMPDENMMRQVGNRLLNEERNYSIAEQKHICETNLLTLNTCQRRAYNAIISSVDSNKGKLIFVQGRGGTGKTYLWNTVIAKIRSEGKIVLPVATSGIAALLLPGGRTAHSKFRIPCDVNAESSCNISHQTNLAELLQETSLIVWDEAPTAHKHCFEALDRSLRDILASTDRENAYKPFGGMTVACGGDFRQILPVIQKGSRCDIVGAALNSSILWDSFVTYELTANMRLKKSGLSSYEADEITKFDEWMLKIGDGSAYDNPQEELINIPNDVRVSGNSNQLDKLIEAVYPSFTTNYVDATYLTERAILAPKNEDVREINRIMLAKLPGESKTYFSSDSVCKGNINVIEEDLLYPTEFLNSLKFSGLPDHEIQLKVGAPVMLVRNLNPTEGLCNGTRLVITMLGKWSIRADIISGSHIGKNVTLPRIILSPNENKWPFKLNRRQFPIILCFAMTINKSQGQSLKSVGLYLLTQVFTHGMLYVAVSRVTSRKGLVILNVDENVDDKSKMKNVVFHEVFRNIKPDMS